MYSDAFIACLSGNYTYSAVSNYIAPRGIPFVDEDRSGRAKGIGTGSLVVQFRSAWLLVFNTKSF